MFKQRDIVLIPFTNLSSNKRRPVVIISNDSYNQANFDIVVVAITSNIVFDNNFSGYNGFGGGYLKPLIDAEAKRFCNQFS